MGIGLALAGKKCPSCSQNHSDQRKIVFPPPPPPPCYPGLLDLDARDFILDSFDRDLVRAGDALAVQTRQYINLHTTDTGEVIISVLNCFQSVPSKTASRVIFRYFPLSVGDSQNRSMQPSAFAFEA